MCPTLTITSPGSPAQLTTSFITGPVAQQEQHGQESDKEIESEGGIPTKDVRWVQRITAVPLNNDTLPGVETGVVSALLYLGIEVPHVNKSPPGSPDHAKYVATLHSALVVEDVSVSASGRTVVVVGRGQEVGDFELTVHVAPILHPLADGSSESGSSGSKIGWEDCSSNPFNAQHSCVLSLSYAALAHSDAASAGTSCFCVAVK